jgi:hypothetical protein
VAILDEMRGSVETLDPRPPTPRRCTTTTSCSGYSGSASLADVKQERLLQANAGLPAILWAVLLIEGLIFVNFTYLFGLRNTLVHTLMVAARALTIALVLFTVGALDYPLRGDVRVRPDAFLAVLDRFETSTLSDL